LKVKLTLKVENKVPGSRKEERARYLVATTYIRRDSYNLYIYLKARFGQVSTDLERAEELIYEAIYT